MGHLLGSKKINFLIREIDDATMAGASVETYQFVVPRSLGGRLWSVLDMGNRLPRMRDRSHRCIHIGKVLCAPLFWASAGRRLRFRRLCMKTGLELI